MPVDKYFQQESSLKFFWHKLQYSGAYDRENTQTKFLYCYCRVRFPIRKIFFVPNKTQVGITWYLQNSYTFTRIKMCNFLDKSYLTFQTRQGQIMIKWCKWQILALLSLWVFWVLRWIYFFFYREWIRKNSEDLP